MSYKQGSERVSRHFDRPQTHAHKGGRSTGERALIAAAVVGGMVLTAPYWIPVVATAAILATGTAIVAAATAPIWAPVALVGYLGYKAFKAGSKPRPAAPRGVPGDMPRKFQHEYPPARRNGDAQRVDRPRSDRRRPVTARPVVASKVEAPKLSMQPRRRRVASALPRP
ncbi:MAG: hypothetical protein Alpg2KO_16670 [Alphaproteobacteria bacterium]